MQLTSSRWLIRSTSAFLLWLTTDQHLLIAQTAPRPETTQKVVIQNGPEVEARKSSMDGMAGYDETGYYIIRTQKKSRFIEHLNTSMSIDKSVKLEQRITWKNLKATYSSCGMFNGHLYLFWIAIDSRNLTLINLVQEINTATLLGEGNLRELNKVIFPGRRSMNRAIMNGMISNIGSSEDESKIMITRPVEREEDDTPTSKEQLIVEVYDDKMNSLWEKTITLPKSRNTFTVESIRIENDGTIYIKGVETQERSEARSSRRAGKPSYTYYIFRYTDNGNTLLEIPLDLGDKFITDAVAATTINGDVVVSGFYSEKGTFSIKGVFYQRINGQTEEIMVRKLTEFDKSFITQYASKNEVRRIEKRERKGDEPELFEFDMDNFLLRQDGGGTLVAEQYYMYVQTVTTAGANGQTTTRYIYHYIYNDILVLNFDAEGVLTWKCKIPKRQHTTNDFGYYSSYTLATIGDKLYFIYNDNPANLSLPENEAPADFMRNRKEVAVVLAEVTAEGVVTRELLLATERGEVIVRPKVCEQTAANQVMLYSVRGKVFQFSKVTFKTL